jgi:CheY-like chemotaxis protein
MFESNPVVLCVDDDSDDQNMVLETIREIAPSVNVATAANGLEALQFLQSAHRKDQLPCLIIMDINMPLLDGKQALVKIKNDNSLKDVPIVMFTTSNSLLDKTFCQQWGIPFMTKPVRQSDLRKTIGELLKYCNAEK